MKAKVIIRIMLVMSLFAMMAESSFADSRLMKDINQITNALDKISQVNGYKYRRYHKVETVEEVLNRLYGGSTSEQARLAAEAVVAHQRKVAESDTAVKIGFIGQEILAAIPELADIGNDGIINLNYDGMIPVLLEAIKELKAEIALLKSQDPKRGKTSDVIDVEGAADKAVLLKNTPNPFTQNTEIQYYLAPETESAILVVYDLTGKELNQYRLSDKGKSRLLINANEFAPGMYLYSLIVDGTEVDTKKMIITK